MVIISYQISMANINSFINDVNYRHNVLNKIELFRESINDFNSKNYTINHINDSVRLHDVLLNNDINTELENNDNSTKFYCSNDYDFDQLHKYEKNIQTVLKIFLNDYICSESNIDEFYFRADVKDMGMKFGTVYTKEWIHLINIKMLINDKVLDYRYIWHQIGDFYNDKRHVIAYNSILLYNLSHDLFEKFPSF